MLLVRRVRGGLVTVFGSTFGGMGRRLRHRLVVDGSVTHHTGHRLERGGVECQQQEDGNESTHGWQQMMQSFSITLLAVPDNAREEARGRAGATAAQERKGPSLGRVRRDRMTKTGKAVTLERSAELSWEGDIVHGSGDVTAQGGAFDAPVRFPSLRGEPDGTTSPEELLAPSHASCFGIGLRSVVGSRGASVTRVTVRTTITAEKGPLGIRILRPHLNGFVEGLHGATEEDLSSIVAAAGAGCTISNAIRDSVQITHEIRMR